MCLAACSDHDVDTRNESHENSGSYMQLRLQVSMGDNNTTRAVPQGGEDGDGREQGVRHENDLNNVTVFVIRANAGMDAAPTTPFLFSGYMQKGDEGWTDQTLGVDVKFSTGDYLPQENDRVIVVANAGNQTSIATLGALRDATTYSAWRNGASLTDDDMFVMSSARNNDQGKVSVTAHEGTLADPYLSSLDIQRTAARIDFMYTSSNFTGATPSDELTYTVKNSTESEQVATVHVDNIIPFNLMQESSYLIKRVTSSANVSSGVNHGALETADGNHIPTNYVIEPHTLTKQGDVTEGMLDQWYGTTRAKTIFANPSSYLSNSGIASYVATQTAASPAELSTFTHYMTLAYTNENTQSKEHHSPDFMTGLLLKTVYEPKTVYSSYAAATLTVDGSYTRGTTFWRYTPTHANMKEEDSKYFSTSDAATAYKNAHPEDLAEIVEYPGGVCYYNIWLRHANKDADPHVTFPMEYAIVRNNIYRVGVERFTGPGTPTPHFNGPDHLHLRIFVRPWNKREHPEIRL